MSTSKRIEELEETLAQYNSAIESTQMKKSIAKVIAGPLYKNGTYTFRLDGGGSELLAPLLPSCDRLPEVGEEVIVAENMIVSILEKQLAKTTNAISYKLSSWNDIIGLDHILEDIKTSVKTLSIDNKIFEEFGVKPVKGILLYGPPGCGKTLIGKAIASDILNSTNVDENQFIFVKGGEMLDKYVGETESRIVAMFKRARDYSKETGNKAVIFIDEADAILGRRNSKSISSSVVPTFLSEMDGLEGDNPFVLLSTNLPDSLDEAVIRDGRIDQKIEISRPDVKAVESLFNFYLAKVKCEDCENIAHQGAIKLFELLPQSKISGAMVSNIINLSAKTAAIRCSLDKTAVRAILWEDVESCLSKLK